jgi:hypothetical protein
MEAGISDHVLEIAELVALLKLNLTSSRLRLKQKQSYCKAYTFLQGVPGRHSLLVAPAPGLRLLLLSLLLF